MKLLSSINIKNFRGFDEFEIKGFSDINIFVGKNNSGKSSVLESIFFLVGMSNPFISVKINNLRGLNPLRVDNVKYLFHNLNLNKHPKIEGSFPQESSRTLELKPTYNINANTNNLESQKKVEETLNIGDSNSSPVITGLEHLFTLKERHEKLEKYKCSFSIIETNGTINQNVNKKYKEDISSTYLASDIKEGDALLRYSEIVKRKKGDVILKALQKIEPKIEAIQALPDAIYFNYKNIAELVPSNIAGDGVRKYLNIVTAIVGKENSIILIDEIENGLHYSAHKLLWESIITIAKEFKVQLFITSHNIETLKALKVLLDTEQYRSEQKKVSVFNIVDTLKKGIQSYKYSYAGFGDAIETGTEIRQ